MICLRLDTKKFLWCLTVFPCLGEKWRDNGCDVHSMISQRLLSCRAKLKTCSDRRTFGFFGPGHVLVVPIKQTKTKTHRRGGVGFVGKVKTDWKTKVDKGGFLGGTLPGLAACQHEIAVIEQSRQRVADRGPVLISKGVGAQIDIGPSEGLL